MECSVRVVFGFGLAWMAGMLTAAQAGAQTVREIAGHKEAVAAVAFAPDGRVLATGSFDKTIKLWDATTLKELRTLHGHSDLVLSLAFSPDGSRLVSGSQDRLVKVWNLGPAGPPRELSPNPTAIRALALRTDVQLLAVAGEDGILRLHDLSKPGPARELKGHAGPIHAAAFLKGDQICSIGTDRTLRVWDLAQGSLVGSIEVGTAPATTLALLPDGTAPFTGDAAGVVKRWSLAAAPVRSLGGHAQSIVKARLTPTGDRVVSVAADKSIRVHDLASGAERLAFTAQEAVHDFSIAARDPNRLIAVEGKGTLRSWSLTDGKLQATQELGALPSAVALLPDGKGVLVGSADGTIRLHPPPAPKAAEPKLIGQHQGGIIALAVSPDGKMVISGGQDGQVRVWPIAGGKELRTWRHEGPVTALALSADGSKVASGSADQTCRIWSLRDGKPLGSISIGSPVAALDLSRDGQRIVVAAKDIARVHLLDGTEVQTFTAQGLHSVAISADGQTVVAAGTGQLLAGQVAMAWHQRHAKAVTALALSPDGSRLVTAAADESVVVRDPRTGQSTRSLGTPDPKAVAVLGDNARFIAAGGDRIVRLYDAATGALLQQFPPAPAPITSLAVSGDQKTIAAADAGGHLSFWSVPSGNTPGTAMGVQSIPAPATHVLFLPDGQSVVASGGDRAVRIVPLPAPPASDLAGHKQQVYAVCFSPDGRQVASAAADNTVIVWDLAAGKPLKTFTEHKAQAYSVAFSPDGKWLASGSGDRTVVVWDVASGKPHKTLTGAEEALYRVAFSADGKQVIAAGVDKRIRIWDIASGKLTRTLDAGEEIYGLALSPNGQRLASSGYAGTLTIWELTSGKPLHQTKLSFGAFDVSYGPRGDKVLVGNNDTKAYLVELPPVAR